MKEDKLLGQESAFPVVAFSTFGEITTPEDFNGMSKRFYTAVQIASALSTRFNTLTIDDIKRISRVSYQITDELLKQETE